MTAVKERFMQILPEMQRDVPNMPDSDVQQIINIYVKWKPEAIRRQPEKELAADGILHHLADPSKIPNEEGAWAKASVEKYRRKMVGPDEVN